MHRRDLYFFPVYVCDVCKGRPSIHLYLQALQISLSYREELQKYDSVCIVQIDVEFTMANT